MKLNDMFPARYVKSEDFAPGEKRTLTIRDVDMMDLGQDEEKETKPVITFRQKDAKPFVCNKTNAQTISELWGEDTDDWMGKDITLYVTKVSSFGKMVPGIRIEETRPAKVTTPAPAQAQSSTMEAEDELFVPIPEPTFGQGVKIKSRQTA
jgi:hypothetical protein